MMKPWPAGLGAGSTTSFRAAHGRDSATATGIHGEHLRKVVHGGNATSRLPNAGYSPPADR